MQVSGFSSVRLDKSLQVPFYQQLYDGLRQNIRSGILTPGVGLPPERQLEELLGVTRSTLRQALALLEKDGLIVRRQGVGTFVERSERWKSIRKTLTLGVVSWREQLESYDLKLSSHLCGEALGLGMEVKAFHWLHGQQPLSARVKQESVEGVIALPTVSQESMAELATLGLPKVILEIRKPQEGLDHVVVDGDAAVRAAVARLMDAGHRAIAFVAGLSRDLDVQSAPCYVPSPDAALRYRSYRLALAERNVAYRPEWYSEQLYNVEAALGWVERWFKMDRLTRPTAVVAFNDHVAMDLWNACRARNISVPADLSIVGFGNFVPESEQDLLATATIDFREMARLAIHRIEERIRFGARPGVTLTAGSKFKPGSSIGPAKPY